MPTVVIRHIPKSDPPQFQVVCASTNRASQPYTVPTPFGYPVQYRPDGLMAELQWYLEKFLNYPYHPETERAERVLMETFEALTESRRGGIAALAALQAASRAWGIAPPDEALARLASALS